ncbi:s-methyl-5-thioribose-1-phosphate isomerase [Ruania albidiflava]|uniref:s-methyl-5-thioribose-1-phosphate isomerase n=1 Tax=Ruania albidiflava TaxID=366586 RepID=UPI0003B764FB|nr:s-methyl-5-thioribose-1-phosphate isomerase [Ruania albidiflava]
MVASQPPVPTLMRDSVLVEDDAIRILDRRLFPFRREWVTCRTYEDVANAIEEMVTQSSGPLFAAAGGMILAARAAEKHDSTRARRNAMTAAAKRLLHTRPTNNGIREALESTAGAASRALDEGLSLTGEVTQAARVVGDHYLARSRTLGRIAAELLSSGETVLTHCWAESYLIETVRAAILSGKELEFFCTETRPYLQGARLTAESLKELGVNVTVVTDGMPAELMREGRISSFVTAADRVTMDGHVINKVGTLQIAVAAHVFDVPYVALVQAPDEQAPTPADVSMEFRDPTEVLYLNGERMAAEGVEAIYPAFDVTPPRFVRTIATDRGRFAPNDLGSYYQQPESRESRDDHSWI